MLRPSRLRWLGACCFVAACSNEPTRAPGLQITFTATPHALQPGETVTLVAVFPAGTARIEPDVGSVENGVSYVVGPFDRGRTYTLTIRAGDETIVRVLEVPLRYRERVGTLSQMRAARSDQGSVRLADGRVLLCGGQSPGPLFWASSEVFDPATGRSTPAGDLSLTRAGSALVALPSGGALAFGGATNENSFAAAIRVEEWEPQARTWSVRGNVLCHRTAHTATRLADGRVLVVGGDAAGPHEHLDAEIWVPSSGARAPAGEMLRRRVAHTATELADGRILIAGGFDQGAGTHVQEAELFDPATETFTSAGNVLLPRGNHAAVRLLDGRVLLVGGEAALGFVPTAELFDPATGRFVPAGDLTVPSADPSAVLLGSGQVLVAGGRVGFLRATARLEVWEPAANSFRMLASGLAGPRVDAAMHTLADGRVVLFGGDAGDEFPVPDVQVID